MVLPEKGLKRMTSMVTLSIINQPREEPQHFVLWGIGNRNLYIFFWVTLCKLPILSFVQLIKNGTCLRWRERLSKLATATKRHSVQTALNLIRSSIGCSWSNMECSKSLGSQAHSQSSSILTESIKTRGNLILLLLGLIYLSFPIINTENRKIKI